ncbi:MAG: hypothetical protein SGJ27_12175 [Candidatus Melainabacteria bacterium]|nr:hypothetical protein [Candidatus Melainabacteria bacterium]
MATEKFTLDDSMSAGWQLLSDNFWTYARLASLSLLLMFLPDMASMALAFNSSVAFLSVIFLLLSVALKIILPLGLINIQIRMVNGQSVSSDDFWTPAGRFLAFLCAALIYAWVVSFGLLMFVVPGIIFGIMFQFFPYFIVEHKLGPIQALKASAAITAGAMWELFLLGVMLVFINGIASLFFVLGMVPAQIFAHLTMTSVYKTLLNNTPPEELPFPYTPDRAVLDGNLIPGDRNAESVFPSQSSDANAVTLIGDEKNEFATGDETIVYDSPALEPVKVDATQADPLSIREGARSADPQKHGSAHAESDSQNGPPDQEQGSTEPAKDLTFPEQDATRSEQDPTRLKRDPTHSEHNSEQGLVNPVDNIASENDKTS